MKCSSLLATSLIALLGCVTDAPKKSTGDAGDTKDAAAAVDTSKPIIPWAVGNNWTYLVTDTNGTTSDKKTAIDAEEMVGGDGPHSTDMAYKVLTLKADNTDQTVSWQAPMGDKVVRYREQSFSASSSALTLDENWDPYKLHIDGSAEHSAANATWLEDYMETKEPVGGTSTTAEQHDRWTVDQVDASITVPAGTFDHVTVYSKAGGSDLKKYWYLRGLGKIKETGGQTEELVSYSVMK